MLIYKKKKKNGKYPVSEVLIRDSINCDNFYGKVISSERISTDLLQNDCDLVSHISPRHSLFCMGEGGI